MAIEATSRCPNEESVRREMAEAGCTNVAVHRVSRKLKAESFDKFWNGIERTNAPLVLIEHRVGPERRRTLGPKIRKRSAPR